jgi:hypothetical protein
MDIRTIKVDFDDLRDLKKHIHKLSNRRKALLKTVGYTAVAFNGSATNAEKILPIFEAIMGCDLSSIYRGLDVAPRYYVYAHCDPTQPLVAAHDIKHLFLAQSFSQLRFAPFYVGKGTGARHLDQSRNDSYRKVKAKIEAANKSIVVVKLREQMTEAESFALESKLIDILGLRATSKDGLLVNLDEGEQHKVRRSLYPPEDGGTKRVLQRNGYVISSNGAMAESG